jgi:hypothetical protein
LPVNLPPPEGVVQTRLLPRRRPPVTTFLAFIFVLGLLSLVAWAAHWISRRRERSLRRLLDRVDALENLLKTTRERMTAMQQVVQRVPQDIAAVAHASLDSQQLVQQGLRDVLEHRLWISQRGLTAPQPEIDAALAALERAHSNIADQLARLENAGAALADATRAQVEQAAREPASLKRAGGDGG